MNQSTLPAAWRTAFDKAQAGDIHMPNAEELRNKRTRVNLPDDSSSSNSLNTDSESASSKKPKASHIAHKAPPAAQPKPPTPTVQVDSEDSEDDELEGWKKIVKTPLFSLPPPVTTNVLSPIVPLRTITSRFSFTMKYPLPITVESQLDQTLEKISNVLDLIHEAINSSSINWSGYPALVPWEDVVVYSDRLASKLDYKTFYDGKTIRQRMARAFLSCYLKNWSLISTKQRGAESGSATKYFSVNIAWVYTQPLLLDPGISKWQSLVQEATSDFEGISVRPALTQSQDPVRSVMFLNSAVNISGNWSDAGHPSCISDLTNMINRLLGGRYDFGLSSRKIDCGSTDEKRPFVMTLECDRAVSENIQRDLSIALPKINSNHSKKERILNHVFTNWVAVPCFSSVATSKDSSKKSIYASLATQEKLYHKSTFSCRISGLYLEHLDLPPPLQYCLSPEMLQALEQETLAHGDTPIRHLLWDRTYKETHQKLIMDAVLQDDPTVESNQKKLTAAIKAKSKEIKWNEVVSALDAKGILHPLNSLPVSKPPNLSLRQFLLSVRSRQYPDEKVMVFESVTVTDDKDLLLVFRTEVQQEAQTICELLPLFLKHEMQVDPIYYCSPELQRTCLDGYYNPITRTGYLGKFKNTIQNDQTFSKKASLPEFCHSFSAEELIRMFKCKSLFPTLAQSNDDDLASLAESILTSPPVQRPSEDSIIGLNRLLQDHNIQVSHNSDDISAMSGASFDSRTSYNAWMIESRATAQAESLQKQKSMALLAQKANQGKVDPLTRDLLCEAGAFNPVDFKQAYPAEYVLLWEEEPGPATNHPLEIRLPSSESEISDASDTSSESTTRVSPSKKPPTPAESDHQDTSSTSTEALSKSQKTKKKKADNTDAGGRSSGQEP